MLNTQLSFAIPKWMKKEWVTYPIVQKMNWGTGDQANLRFSRAITAAIRLRRICAYHMLSPQSTALFFLIP